jgi:hypothetical protein
MTTSQNLPEGVLRSTFLPLDVRGGTRLFLSYENGWYIVHTRFENFARRRKLDPAVAIYESIELGKRQL